MRRHRNWVVICWGSAILLGGSPSFGQQVQVTTPFHSINESFYENFGVGLGGINRMGPRGGWFFSGMPATSTPPPFGGYDPGADARFGFRAGPFDLNLVAGQGSNRSMVMQSPTIVLPHGGTGHVFDGSHRPFVTGVVPVVGHPVLRPVLDETAYSASPLADRLQRLTAMESAAGSRREAAPRQPPVPAPHRSEAPARGDDPPLVLHGRQPARESGAAAESRAVSTATRGDVSLREIRQQQAEEDAARRDEVLVLVERARGQEAAGKPGVAKIYYQQAAARAEGELRQQLLAKLNSLGKGNPDPASAASHN